MSDARRLLTAMGAPEALVAHVPEDLEVAWERAERAEHVVWLTGAASISLGETLRVLSGLLAEALVEIPEAEPLVMAVLETAEACVRRDATRADALERAEEAERAAQDAPATFRNAPPKAYREVVLASARVARAAEAIMSARLRDEAAQLDRARNAAAYLGAGLDVFARRMDAPARLDASRLEDPVHAELLFVVASLAEAARMLEIVQGAVGGSTGPALAGLVRDRHEVL